jgi:integrase
VKLLITKIFKYAYTEDIIKNTEIFGKLELKNFKLQTKDKIRNNPTLIEKKDIKVLYQSILEYKHNLITKYLMLMTIHTAQRQGSLITAKWKDINFEDEVWMIPKENMKGTINSKKDHNVPLSNVLIKYLKELHSLTGGNEYIFPNSQLSKTRNKYPHISNNTVTNALRLMGYTKEQQTAHGFRAMFKTVCKEHQEAHQLNNEFVERVLAHKVEGTVEATYNRAINIEDMRKIVNWWSEYLEGLKDKDLLAHE